MYADIYWFIFIFYLKLKNKQIIILFFIFIFYQKKPNKQKDDL